MIRFTSFIAYRARTSNFERAEQFEMLCQASEIKRLAPGQRLALGFVPNPDGTFASQLFGATMVTVAVDEKRVPKPAIEREVSHRVNEFSKAYQRSPEAAELNDIRRKTVDELLANAIVHRKEVQVLFDRPTTTILVGTAGVAIADEVITFLRRVLDVRRIYPLHATTHVMVREQMTAWIRESNAGIHWELGEDANFLHRERGEVKVRRRQLEGNECRKLVDTGHWCVAVQLNIPGVARFLLNDKLQVNQIDFEPIDPDQSPNRELAEEDAHVETLNRIRAILCAIEQHFETSKVTHELDQTLETEEGIEA